MGTKKPSSEDFVFKPFRDLKKILDSKKKDVPTKSVSAKKDKPISEEELFIGAMKEVQEIKDFRKIPVNQKEIFHTYKKTPSDDEALKALEDIVKGRSPISLPDTPEYVEWINPNYREDILKKLHEGKYSVQDCLDLHGIIVEEAESEVERFFKESLKKGYQCIKIVHGRGLRSTKGPVLKDAVVKWLLSRYRKYIIAFVTARQCDGGLGAMYILMK